jgi:hypothetical protein
MLGVLRATKADPGANATPHPEDASGHKKLEHGGVEKIRRNCVCVVGPIYTHVRTRVNFIRYGSDLYTAVVI